MHPMSFALTSLVQDAEPSGFQRILHALPHDTPSIVTLLIAAAAVGLVIWSGTRSGGKQSR